MTFRFRLASLAVALPLLASGAVAPAAHSAAATPVTSSTATALIRQIQARFPKATVQINPIGGRRKSYAVYVVLTAQPNASIVGGAGAQILASYVRAYPHQGIYALYSYERDRDGMGFWEYEFVPSASLLRRYRFAIATKQSYPWVSWRLSESGLFKAAQAGSWPSNGTTHTPAAPVTHQSKKK